MEWTNPKDETVVYRVKEVAGYRWLKVGPGETCSLDDKKYAQNLGLRAVGEVKPKLKRRGRPPKNEEKAVEKELEKEPEEEKKEPSEDKPAEPTISKEEKEAFADGKL